MANEPRPATSPVEKAQRERARYAVAAQWAEEVSAQIVEQTTAAQTALPPSIFAAVVQDKIDISTRPAV